MKELKVKVKEIPIEQLAENEWEKKHPIRAKFKEWWERLKAWWRNKTSKRVVKLKPIKE